MKKAFEFVTMSCKELADDSPYYTQFLDPRELFSIKRAVSKRRIEFLHGRICAKYALAELTGSRMYDRRVCILSDCMGAPFCETAGGHFLSITHGDGLAAAVACDSTAVTMGVDVQKVEKKSAADIRAFLRGGDREFYDSRASEFGADVLAVAIWVAKEAASKLFRMGFSIYPVLGIGGASHGSDGSICIEFKNFKNFCARIVPYRDYLFGFAFYERNMKAFELGKIREITWGEVLSGAVR